MFVSGVACSLEPMLRFYVVTFFPVLQNSWKKILIIYTYSTVTGSNYSHELYAPTLTCFSPLRGCGYHVRQHAVKSYLYIQHDAEPPSHSLYKPSLCPPDWCKSNIYSPFSSALASTNSWGKYLSVCAQSAAGQGVCGVFRELFLWKQPPAVSRNYINTSEAIEPKQ